MDSKSILVIVIIILVIGVLIWQRDLIIGGPAAPEGCDNTCDITTDCEVCPQDCAVECGARDDLVWGGNVGGDDDIEPPAFP